MALQVLLFFGLLYSKHKEEAWIIHSWLFISVIDKLPRTLVFSQIWHGPEGANADIKSLMEILIPTARLLNLMFL
jgi:hypothetical protein